MPPKTHLTETGYTLRSDRSLAWVQGLPGARLNEIVEFATGQTGFVQKVIDHVLQVAVFSQTPVTIGTPVAQTNHLLSYHTPHHTKVNIDIPPPPISQHAPITEQCVTQIPIIDILMPLARGQRQLILGDHNLKKTATAVTIAQNLARQGTQVIYAMIGKTQSEINSIIEALSPWENATVIASNAADSAAEIIITPLKAMALAETYKNEGIDSLVILDDLTITAKLHRQLALLSDQFPGRDAYPADIFHNLARLLERAGNFHIHKKNVSITCLCLADTQESILTGFIPTTCMSITDGHYFFDHIEHHLGLFPAINTGLSVTRLGRQTQSPIAQKLSTYLLSAKNQGQAASSVSHLSTGLHKSTLELIDLYQAITHFCFYTQPTPLSVSVAGAALVAHYHKKIDLDHLTTSYHQDHPLKTIVDKINQCTSLSQLDQLISKHKNDLTKFLL